MVTKLTPVKIKDIWKTEDRDFTPWLVENINLLNEQLGLNIIDPQSETRLVSFKVDIIGEDEQGKVIIENQFYNSDHDHLGKLITYLSNVNETKKAIWIVEEAKPEHIKAIEWLNQNSTSCLFYLVKIQLFKVDDSQPAAQFSVISGPDESTIAVGKVKKEDTERDHKRFEFWSLFLEKLKNKTSLYSNISPRKNSWIGTGSGTRGIQYNCIVRKTRAAAEIYIDRGKDAQEINNNIFNELKNNKEQIEKDFGSELVWEDLPNARACRISKSSEIGGWVDEETWDEVHAEMINLVIQLEKTFTPYIKNIQKIL